MGSEEILLTVTSLSFLTSFWLKKLRKKHLLFIIKNNLNAQLVNKSSPFFNFNESKELEAKHSEKIWFSDHYNHIIFCQDKYFDFSFPSLNTIPQTLFLLTFLPLSFLLPSIVVYFIPLLYPRSSTFTILSILPGLKSFLSFSPYQKLLARSTSILHLAPSPNSCSWSPLLLPRLAL